MPVKFDGDVGKPTSHLGQKGPYVQSWTTNLQKELRIHEQLILEQTELHKKIEVLSVELHNIWSENSQLQYLYSNTNVHEPFDLPNTTLELNNMTLSNPSAYSTLEAKVEKLHTANENFRTNNIELANVLQNMGLNSHVLRDQNTKLRKLLIERNALTQRLKDAELQRTGKIAALNTLGLQGEPSQAEIHRAYRALVMQVHPDKTINESPESIQGKTERFKAINAANEYLRNPFLVRSGNPLCVKTAVPLSWLFTTGKNE
jgi:DnaJ-domain-containing protein 1